VSGPEIALLIVLIAVIVLAAGATVTVMIRCGWIEGSASLRIVPPWKRKAPERREARTAPASEPATGPVPISEKRGAA
jgi:hypothetical protein